MNPLPQDAVIDLETKATTQDGIIMSVGIVSFYREPWKYAARMKVNILENGQCRRSDPDTEKWWEQQSKSARNRLLIPAPITVDEALQEISTFLKTELHPKVRLWGNGDTFDISILQNMYEQHKVDVPWEHYQPRDIRTLVDVGRFFETDPKKTEPFLGVKHCAFDDAMHEATYVMRILMHLEFVKNSLTIPLNPSTL